MTSSQGQLVNEVESTAHLLALCILAVPVLLIHLADVIHMILYSKTCGVSPASHGISFAYGMDSAQHSEEHNRRPVEKHGLERANLQWHSQH